MANKEPKTPKGRQNKIMTGDGRISFEKKFIEAIFGGKKKKK